MKSKRLSTFDIFKWRFISLFILATICFGSCSTSPSKSANDSGSEDKPVANVNSVQVTGTANAYTFSVGIQSPDSGCGQYADWWEVLSESGSLLYRRILAHSHVNEQPFTRSGGPLKMEANEVVYIRAHMHPHGYGGIVYKGSVQNGFDEFTVAADFAQSVETEPPLPTDCAF